jgi:hypothetical protein
VDADGTDDALVRSEPDGDGCAYREFNEGLWWLPDGRLLYLCLDDIVTINPDGTGRTVQGNIPDDHTTMYDADLSPDGTRFAGPWGEGDVNVWNWTTGGTSQLTTDEELREWMTWSPDGTKILYAKGASTMTIPAGGGGETVLSSDGGYQYAWQPCVAGTTVTCSAKTLNGTLLTTGGGGTTTSGGAGGTTTTPPTGGGTTPPPAFTAFDARPAFSGAQDDQPQDRREGPVRRQEHAAVRDRPHRYDGEGRGVEKEEEARGREGQADARPRQVAQGHAQAHRQGPQGPQAREEAQAGPQGDVAPLRREDGRGEEVADDQEEALAVGPGGRRADPAHALQPLVDASALVAS